MARIKEKVKASKVVSTVWNWVAFGVLAAVVVTGIVLGIIALVDHFSKEDETEKTYTEIYESEKLHITLAELEKILDNDQKSELIADKVYVYVYSANTDDYTLTTEDEYKEVDLWVKACIEGFENPTSSNSVNFFLVNIELEENKEFMEENSSVGSISLSSFGNPVLLEITATSNVKYESYDILNNDKVAIQKFYDAYQAATDKTSADAKLEEIQGK